MTESLKQVLMRRAGLTNEEADELIDEAKKRVYAGDDLGEILREEFGLELDYLFDILP